MSRRQNHIARTISTKMPGMIRQPGLATRIVFRILGKPANLTFKRSKSQQKIAESATADETRYVK